MSTTSCCPACSRSPSIAARSRARIRGVDLEAARTIPGVRAIFTAEDLEAAREWDIKVRLAFDADARLLAADVDYQTNVGAWPIMVDAGGLTMLMFPGPYRLPKLAFQGRAWYSNTAGMAAYRGPWLSETVGREALMDKAARQIGICPVELRRRNMVTREEQPHTHPTGIEIRNVTPRETPG